MCIRDSLGDRLDLLGGTPGPGGRKTAGHQVVARVAVLDLDHVARSTEAGDLVREDELCHRPSSLSEPSSSTGGCLLYTSDAADDLLCVELGGRRIIKKK